MAVSGIIAEYNPFHSGHEFLLNQARMAAGEDPVIVIMSGNYVQRGEMAITDKWTRAKYALMSGADLVFELPFAYAVEPADIFAEGSMEILSKLGVENLVFGVEDANLNFTYLGQRIAEIPKGKMDFKDYSQTYSTQYNQMVAREVGREVNEPNIILALAYAVANSKLKNPMTFTPITRIGANHDDLLSRERVVQSASAIRNYLLNKPDLETLEEWLPKAEAEFLIKQNCYPNWNLLFDFLKYRIESSSLSELRQIYQMSEGLEFKIKHEIHSAYDFTDFLRRVKSKRYTYSRLRRLSLYTLLNITQSDIDTARSEISTTLLGYSKRGRNYLKYLRKHAEIPIVSKVDQKNSKFGSLALDVRVDRLFEQIIGVDQNFGRRPSEVK
ncbi:nucleotidyltransferase [Lactobacillus psittaci]|uniref:tRNA(Met) cytidine acetate ligase n=1 Tax=Lactobacillus psittaci DSM 15354 TaxID=1122152 RepID=A0A0R1RZM1_9LACO|nr:nucleotidyltransferase [Lactobacillus psittaci]KRL62364.1 hypothetical protein FC23_GL000308 [Lactobacillus psittaci DSM 15354]